MPKTNSGTILFNECVDEICRYANSNPNIIKNVRGASRDVSFMDFMGILKKPKTQMVIEFNTGRKVRIMTRFLDIAGGSVTEKIPYFIECAKRSIPEDEIILLFDGEGYTSQMKTYMNNAILNSNKNIKIYSLSMFRDWINNNLKEI